MRGRERGDIYPARPWHGEATTRILRAPSLQAIAGLERRGAIDMVCIISCMSYANYCQVLHLRQAPATPPPFWGRRDTRESR